MLHTLLGKSRGGVAIFPKRSAAGSVIVPNVISVTTVTIGDQVRCDNCDGCDGCDARKSLRFARRSTRARVDPPLAACRPAIQPLLAVRFQLLFPVPCAGETGTTACSAVTAKILFLNRH